MTLTRLKTLSQARVGQQTNISELQDLIIERLGIDPEKMTGGKTSLHDTLAVALD